ncbi:MAG: apolipoprotein N-acyltransferase [Stenotrophobium sp.]
MRPLQSLKRFDVPAALLLGAAATLGFAPFNLWPLAPLALAGLYALTADVSAKRAAGLGWAYGFTHFASGVYWVFISTYVYGGAPEWLGLTLAVVLFAYLAIYPALALGLMARLRLHSRAAGWWGVPALWLLTELLRGSWIFNGFPWLSLGYVALDTPLQKLAPLTGVYGVSAVLSLLAFALYRFCAGRQRGLALAILLSPLLCLLLPEPSQWTHAEGKPLTVAIIQGDIPQDQKWLPEMEVPTLARYHDMTLAAKDANLIVWPEAALTRTYGELAEDYFAPLSASLRQSGAALLAGVLTGSADGKRYYNSIIAAGAASGRYDKHHLVPFGEYFPIPDWLRPLMDVLGTPYSDFGVGATEQAPIVVDGQRIGISICFEDVFPSEYRRTAGTSSLMVNATNDAWFGRSGADAQHLQIARMRAVETGRVLLRASNTGISAVIGPDGELLAQSGFFTLETLRAKAQPRGGETPYVRWGDAPLWWLSALLVVLLLLLRRRVN